MTTPNKELCRLYGTEKDASPTPFAARLFFAMTAMGMAEGYQKGLAHQQRQAEAMNDMFEQLQQAELAPTTQGLRGAPVPFVAGPEDPYARAPVALTPGMVRTAAVAKEAGATLAKLALGAKPGILARAKGLGYVGAGALGLAGLAASKPTMNYMRAEQPRQTYGATDFGGRELAHGVNRWGQPETGTPFVT